MTVQVVPGRDETALARLGVQARDLRLLDSHNAIAGGHPVPRPRARLQPSVHEGHRRSRQAGLLL